MKRFFKNLNYIIFCLFILVSTIGSFYTVSADEKSTDILKLLEGKTAGVTTGTPQDQIVLDNISNAKLQYYNNISDLTLALKTKKVDFIVLSSVNYYGLVQQNPEFGYLDIPLKTYDVGTIFPMNENGEALRKQFNQYISKLKESNQLEELQNQWLFSDDYENIDIPESGENGILKMATSNTFKPFSFMLNDKNVGYDIAVVSGFAQEYGYGLQIENVDFAGTISGISTGKYDLAANQISYTEERAESVLFSDFYYTQQMVPIVNADDFPCSYLITSSNESTKNQNTLWTNIRKTLIDENRWISILKGLLVTIEITVGAFIVANLFGCLFCVFALSKNKLLSLLNSIYVYLMQGLPMIIILMMFYYIVFAKSSIDSIFIAILGLGLIFGGYLSQLFEGGIRGIDKGQWEAGLSSGLTSFQTFQGIILPQVVRNLLPGYFSNFISLLKSTSIVGYIAITDLTKVGDIIRSNTFEAIVPLCVVAFIYLILASLLILIMKWIQRNLFHKKGGVQS